jgi:hypothetical protein
LRYRHTSGTPHRHQVAFAQLLLHLAHRDAE